MFGKCCPLSRQMQLMYGAAVAHAELIYKGGSSLSGMDLRLFLESSCGLGAVNQNLCLCKLHRYVVSWNFMNLVNCAQLVCARTEIRHVLCMACNRGSANVVNPTCILQPEGQSFVIK